MCKRYDTKWFVANTHENKLNLYVQKAKKRWRRSKAKNRNEKKKRITNFLYLFFAQLINFQDYGTLSCWGQNEVGVQRQPCVFQVVLAGKSTIGHSVLGSLQIFEIHTYYANVNAVAERRGGYIN